MKEIRTNLITEAVFSDDQTKRYLLRKEWDGKKPKLAIIMLAPSEASGIELDSTTLLVLNNASRLGYGSVTVLNLFATLDDFTLKQAEETDSENLDIILQEAEKVDTIIYAPGVGKAKNKVFQKRQRQVVKILRQFEEKLYCLCDQDGNARLQHPLSPAVRTWYLSSLKVNELIPVDTDEKQEGKKALRRKEK